MDTRQMLGQINRQNNIYEVRIYKKDSQTNTQTDRQTDRQTD